MTALRTETFELNGCTATLMLGDCLELLPWIKADHVVADPPYSAKTHLNAKTNKGQTAAGPGTHDSRKPLGFTLDSASMTPGCIIEKAE